MNQERLNAERNELKSKDTEVLITEISGVTHDVKRTEGKLQVIHGANMELFENEAGTSVASVRKKLRDILTIPKDAEAMINGEVVGDDFILENGQTLEFFKKSGEKG